jgi:methyl-accepting chemotaxis protein
MSTRPSIRLQIVFVVAGFCVFLVAIGGLGLFGLERLHEQAGRVFAVLCGTALAFAAAAGPLLLQGIVKPLDAAQHIAARIAAGNLSIDVPNAGVREFAALQTALAAMQGSLRSTVAQIREASDEVAATAARISTGSTDLGDHARQQASGLEAAASSAQQLNVSVAQTQGTARQADTLARQASVAAAHGGEKVTQVVVSINAIERSTGRMAEITDVIDGIAFQTNILALNAAVEAARAGDKGRGFAVVAAEVRALAKRSADAAREIASLIASSATEVREGVCLAHETGATIVDVVGQVKRLSECVADIAAANADQAGGLVLMTEAVDTLDRLRQRNAALIEEGAAAARALRDQSLALSDAVSAYRLIGASRNPSTSSSTSARSASPSPESVA